MTAGRATLPIAGIVTVQSFRESFWSAVRERKEEQRSPQKTRRGRVVLQSGERQTSD